jgi:ABC-type uncharacterized transport system permease subunit
MLGIVPYLINALVYAALGVYFWRTRWSAAPATDIPEKIGALEHHAVLVPLALQTVLLYQSMFQGPHLYLGVGNSLSLIIWLTVLIYWLANFFYNLEGLQMLMMPVAAVCCVLPVVLPPLGPVPHTELVAFKLHLMISMLAYSLFTIASLHMLLMTLLEKRLHGGNMPAIFRRLPPLLTMERLSFRVIAVGFVLLTLTLASGILFSEELFGQPLRFNHKNLFGVLSWIIFAALLGGRQFYGWRGRIAVRWTLTGFFVLILAYIGSTFVLEVLLGRV